MFKPLLRTLPSLSGNFTIGCKLNEIQRINSNEYYTYIRTADLMPLQNSLYSKGITISLLNGKYEYDVQKYFYIYSNYFYKENYQYDQKNYKILDIDNRNDSISDARNKDYEFGCKRISRSTSNYTFSFYAPIYIDDVESLPEYFVINLKFNNHNIKTIKVYIGKDNSINYLKKYLSLYLSKITSQVIFCLPDSLQATYFGIDVKRGGLTQYKDNVIGSIFSNQTTINNFDNIICKGFERNNLIMRQIIPLSFMFNLEDLFNEYETEFFKGYKINVEGYYCTKNDIRYDFYDFDIDYWQSYQTFNKYDYQTGLYKITNGVNSNNENINVMDIGYPSLNESKYIKYIFTNKLTPKYCKFKMLLSDDNDPYISNLSFAYSYLQNPNQKYGYFPSLLKGIHAEAIIKDNDLKLPIGNNIDTHYTTSLYFANNIFYDSSNFDKYKKLMETYCSCWYNPCNADSFDINKMIGNSKYWSDIKFNYSYFKGILYNLTHILSKYDIDKFGVFTSLNLNYINEDELNNNIVNAKYVLSKNETSDIEINSYKTMYDMSISYIINSSDENFKNYTYYHKLIDDLSSKKDCYLLHNKLMKENVFGNYIEEKNFENETQYYKMSDIINVIYKLFGNNDELINELINDLSLYKKIGFVLIDTYSNKNLFVKYDTVDGVKYKFLLYDELFTNPNPQNRYSWLLNKLYCTTSFSKSKTPLKDVYNKINIDDEINGKTVLFLKEELIHKYDIINSIKNYLESLGSLENNATIFSEFILNLIQLDTYYNELYSEINGLDIDDYFVKSLSKKYSLIYVDSYNIKSLIEEHNLNNDANNQINADNFIKNKSSKYIKIIDKNHLKEYLYKINKDENLNSTLPYIDNILKYIYIKNRNWIIDENVLSINNSYISIYDYFTSINDEYKILFDGCSNNELILWLINNISDVRSLNNSFTYSDNENTIDLNIYVKKDVYVFNKELYTLLMNNSSNISTYLYLYIEDNGYDTTSWNVLNNNYKKEFSSYIFSDNNEIIPLFVNVYVNDTDVTTIESMINNNKISNYKYIYNDDKVFKEIDVIDYLNSVYANNNEDNLLTSIMKNSDVLSLWEEYVIKNVIDVNDENIKIYQIEFIHEYFKDTYYKQLIKNTNIKLYSIEDTLNINLNSLSDDNLIYDEENNIYIYEDPLTDLKYAFYLINCNLTNSNNSFYIKNDYNLNIRFESINGHQINYANKEYFTNIFYILMPFLKINVFEEFGKIIKTIIYPNEFEINIKYGNHKLNVIDENKYYVLKENDTDSLYDKLTQLTNERKIKLLRYFNYITPYLYKTHIIHNCWEHKFIDKFNNTLFIEKYNILDKSDINIYKYNGITLYTSKYDKESCKINDKETIYQIEYKHFNDNVIFNLPKEIIVNDPKEYSYNEISDIINETNNLDENKKYILYKYFKKNNLEYNSIILFLFNKYDASFFINKTYSSAIKENSKYNITYKFNLI